MISQYRVSVRVSVRVNFRVGLRVRVRVTSCRVALACTDFGPQPQHLKILETWMNEAINEVSVVNFRKIIVDVIM